MERVREQWKAREVARTLSLVESERRFYQEIVAAIPVGLVVLSPNLEIVSANHEGWRIFGGAAVGGENIDPLTHSLDQYLPAEMIETIRSAAETGTPQSKIVVTRGNPARTL